MHVAQLYFRAAFSLAQCSGWLMFANMYLAC